MMWAVRIDLKASISLSCCSTEQLGIGSPTHSHVFIPEGIRSTFLCKKIHVLTYDWPPFLITWDLSQSSQRIGPVFPRAIRFFADAFLAEFDAIPLLLVKLESYFTAKKKNEKEISRDSHCCPETDDHLSEGDLAAAARKEKSLLLLMFCRMVYYWNHLRRFDWCCCCCYMDAFSKNSQHIRRTQKCVRIISTNS